MLFFCVLPRIQRKISENKQLLTKAFYDKLNSNKRSIKLRGEEMAGIKYDIEKNLGMISENAKGWTKQLNLISWNERPAKYDIRDWSPENEKMGKGLTLSKEELRELKILLNAIDLD